MAKPDINVDSRLMNELTAVAARAAATILTFPRAKLDHRLKPDSSPVTAADEASEAIILEGLERHMAGVPAISEESASRAPFKSMPDTFVIVDPLDGTREFMAGRDEYTVNIGVINAGAPVAGIIAAPELGLMWRGIVGRGAERLPLAANVTPHVIRSRRPGNGELIVTVSRSHLDPRTEVFVSRLANVKRIASGSAIKFCRLAEGAADLYPRLAPTCEWDVAAGHAVLAAAGGTVTSANGEALRYGRAGQKFVVPDFIARGDPDLPLPPLT